MDSIKPPQETIISKVSGGTKESIKSFMGPASPLLDLIFPSFHQKRLEAWRENIYKALLELSKFQDEFAFERLRENEEFTSILIQAVQVASRNHQESKLNHLKNVILNTPESSLNTDIKLTFLRFVDELSVNHIKLLTSISQNEELLSEIENYLEFITLLKGKDAEIDWYNHEFKIYLMELISRGLIRVSDTVEDFEGEVFGLQTLLMSEVPKGKLPKIIVLETGKAFLDFIKEKHSL
ncbi:MAG: hypothetical protein JWO09_865 [Bacteroidetes bacterium]|nr:hypothetical protein [Bacteroidota bacterium]